LFLRSREIFGIPPSLESLASFSELGQIFKLTLGSSTIPSWPSSNKRQLVKKPSKLPGVDQL